MFSRILRSIYLYLHEDKDAHLDATVFMLKSIHQMICINVNPPVQAPHVRSLFIFYPESLRINMHQLNNTINVNN